MELEFRLLGDVEVRAGGRLVDVGHARQRCVLVALLVDANRVVPVDQLLDRVWADRPPRHSRGSLSGYVSRLRGMLAGTGRATISRRHDGYVLTVDAMAVDLHRFHDLTARARAVDGDAAMSVLEQALGLWRGEAFATLDTPWVNAVREALDAERLATELDRNDLALRRGQHAELLGELSARTAAHPLHERLAAQFLLALCRCGRQADALAYYERLRRRLADELGVDPGRQLQGLHAAILRQDPAVTATAAEPVPRRSPVPLRLGAADGTDAVEGIELGRQARERQSWAQAFAHFAEADSASPLAVDDLERFAAAASMLGRGDDEVRLLRRAYLAHAEAEQVGSALRCGYWLCKALAFDGELAQAGAWLARAQQLAETDPGCDEFGYLLMFDAERLLRAGKDAEMLAVARSLVDLAGRSRDRDLAAGAATVLGVALIRTGEIRLGLAQLDEAMVAVVGGELSPRATVMIYCVVIGVCRDLHDLRRAREWSVALAGWCDAQPEFTGAYRGECRVHRVAIMRLGGGWPEAVREARLACRQLTGGLGDTVAGGAFYQLAELHRLRGEFGDAERAYREVSRYGWDNQPGMALLRLAQGRHEQAAAGIRRVLAEVSDRMHRARLLPAAVEVLLAVGDTAGAGRAAAELCGIADEYETTALRAMAAYTTGSVLLAEGAVEKAPTPLRHALRLWREMGMPYEAARAQLLIALACRALGDVDAAAMELESARQAFVRLGANADVATVDTLAAAAPA